MLRVVWRVKLFVSDGAPLFVKSELSGRVLFQSPRGT